MDSYFDRKKIKFILIATFLALTFASCVFAGNDVWIGSISELSLQKLSEQEIGLRVVLQEYTAEGKFENFDESTVFFLNRDKNFKQWTFILDNVGAGKLQNYKHSYQNKEMAFVSAIEVSERQGSFSNASRSQTTGGKNITTAKCTITGYVPIYLYMKEIDKKNSSLISVLFVITDKIPENQTKSSQQNGKIEFSIVDFQKQQAVGKFLSRPKETSPDAREYIQRLKELPQGTYVTVVYKAKYHDISVLKTQLDQIKSDLGKLSTIEGTSQIIMRDRSEYVLEMLEMLMVIDQPVPQVAIDVQIVERKIENGADFSSSFNYLRKDGTGFGGGVGYQALNNNLSGVYSNMSNDLLERLQININSEIKQGKSKLKATTRILCKNHQAAQFKAGSSIPYYQMSDISKDDNTLFYRTHNRVKSKSNSHSQDSDDTTDTKSSSDSNTDYTYDQDQQNLNRKWKLTFISTGVNLWVQPSIKNSNLVEIALKPSYSEITGMQTYTDVPVLSDRSLDTSLTVKDGDTILVAGLLYDKEIKMVKGIPVLMDIPLIGPIFCKEVSGQQQTEIIFILTIYIQYPNPK